MPLRGPHAVARIGPITVEVWEGDITEAEVDAIVNAANSLMIMGGGVAGAIRRAAGEEVEREARKYAPVPVGEAIVTHAGRLQPRVKYIIHAPTMERPAMPTTREKVRRAALAALRVAAEKGIDSVAMPALGAGVGRVPVREAVKAILEAIEEHARSNSRPSRVMLVAYLPSDVKAFIEALEEFCRRSDSCQTIQKGGEA